MATPTADGADTAGGREGQERRPAGPLAWFTLDRTAIGAVLALTFAIAMRPATDNDTWWHLRSGQAFVARHGGLGIDRFSHTTGVVRAPSDWLGQVAMYLDWKVFGLHGLAVGVAVLATAGCGFIAAATRGPALLRAGLVALAAATSSLFWSARPQMVSFLGACIVVWVLARARRGIRPTWWLVAVFLVWSNVHLGWAYGLVVLWAATAGAWADPLVDRWWRARPGPPAGWPTGEDGPSVFRRLVAVAVASTVACLVNPVGLGGPRLLWTQVTVGRGYVQEGQPPSLGDHLAWPFFLLLALTLLVVAVRWRHARLAELAPLLAVTLSALAAMRAVSLFAAVAVPFVSWQLADLLDERLARSDRTAGEPGPDGGGPGTSPAFNAIVLGVVVVLSLGLSAQRVSDAATDATLDDYPVAATSWVRAHRPPGPLFNTFDWGGWFIWELPGYPVSIDGRAELYTGPLETYGDLENGVGVSRTLDAQRDNLAVVPTGSPLDRAITALPGWRVAHRDPTATVHVRRTPLRPR